MLRTRFVDWASTGSIVMSTGIVSVALALVRRQTLSWILLAIAVVLWVGLAAMLVRGALRRRGRVLEEAARPEALTVVAATAVVGDRLTLLGQDWAGYALLATACSLWLALVPRVLRRWTGPSRGVSFMLTVATESLAVLAAVLGIDGREAWLGVAALAPFLLGLAAYLFVLSRIDARQVLAGRGDQWIFGGALAIATLACARTTAALAAGSALAALRPVLRDTALALWTAAALWLPVLVAGELIAPRLAYDSRRWATVFPLGMYAVCSIAAGSATGFGGLSTFGRVWIWVAVAAWAIVGAWTLRRGAAFLRG